MNYEMSWKTFFTMSTKTLDDKFKRAVHFVQSMPKDGPVQPSNDDKLAFYGLFKQSSDGYVFFSCEHYVNWNV
jgi:hypothetical protein